MSARPPPRGEVYLIGPDPTRRREMKKTRSCVVVSPDELNTHLRTVIVAPLTSAGKPFPFLPCQFENRPGLVVLDQIGTVDRARLLRRLGSLSGATLQRVLRVLREMFEV